jgi:hypothetical protein
MSILAEVFMIHVFFLTPDHSFRIDAFTIKQLSGGSDKVNQEKTDRLMLGSKGLIINIIQSTFSLQ